MILRAQLQINELWLPELEGQGGVADKRVGEGDWHTSFEMRYACGEQLQGKTQSQQK